VTEKAYDEAFYDRLRSLIFGGDSAGEKGPPTVADSAPCSGGTGDDPWIGRTLGRYLVLERIGEGAQSVVYRGLHLGLLKPVALKILKAAWISDETARRRFEREARVAAGITHPGIIAVRDVGVSGHVPWLAMDLVEGLTLRAWARSASRTLDEKLALMDEVARALDHAHRHGVIHRDLKPENILVDAAGRPVVIDLGLALALDDPLATRPGTRLGTPAYMAPEQVRADSSKISGRTDVYAIGAILYELVAGHPPLCGDSASEIYGAILAQRPAPPSHHNPHLSGDLDAVCLKALEKDPAHRYPAASALAEDLTRIRRGEVPAARPLSMPARVFHRLARKPGPVAAALVILALTATGILLAARDAGRQAHRDRALLISEAHRVATDRLHDLLVEAMDRRARPGDEVQSLLREAGRRLEDFPDQTGTTAGHLAWLNFVVGLDPERHGLRAALNNVQDNPLLYLLLARTFLLQYAESATWPDLRVGFGRQRRAIEVAASAEPPQLKVWRAAAREALDAARALPIWSHLALGGMASYLDGFDAFARGEWQLCLEHLEESAGTAGLFVESQLLITLACFRLDDLDGAVAMARRLFERRPRLLIARRNLAVGLRALAIRRLAEGEDVDSLLAEARAVLEGAEDSGHSLALLAAFDLLEAETQAWQGVPARAALDRAITRYGQILERNPGDVEARVNRAAAVASLSFGRPEALACLERALDDLRNAEERAPSDPVVVRNRIMVEAEVLKKRVRDGEPSDEAWDRLSSDLDRLASLGCDRLSVRHAQGSVDLCRTEALRQERRPALERAKKAEQAFAEILSEEPDWPEVRQFLFLSRFLVTWEDPNPSVERILALAGEAEGFSRANPRFAYLADRLLPWLDHLLDRAIGFWECESPTMEPAELLHLAESLATRLERQPGPAGEEGRRTAAIRRARARAALIRHGAGPERELTDLPQLLQDGLAAAGAALALQPDDPEALLLRAEFRLRQDELEDVRGDLRAVRRAPALNRRLEATLQRLSRELREAEGDLKAP
jgi:tRNA A-37 threonylcarbamoyl transferase component Bud32/tetratricopeptide (TPR) repeat protein